MTDYDPRSTALEIREQLSSGRRRLALLVGAGASMAAGLPGIAGLSGEVEQRLEEPLKSKYKTIEGVVGTGADVEQVLSRIRLCRELIGQSDTYEVDGLSGHTEARELDFAVCRLIYEVVEGRTADLTSHHVLAQWLHILHPERDFPVEVFTTNYDLLIERALEQARVPFFDGFIGSVEPFFSPTSVEADERQADPVRPPRGWTRLWKIHGSIGWRLQVDADTQVSRIVRVPMRVPTMGEELMIFPSREKYEESRKLPFITFQDRLRRVLSSGEMLLVIIGYSFSDQHLNQILFDALSGSNSRLAVTALLYGELEERHEQWARAYRNLSMYAANGALVGGLRSAWSTPEPETAEGNPYWDATEKRFLLGDFKAFAAFLERSVGLALRAPTLGTEDSAETHAPTPLEVPAE